MGITMAGYFVAFTFDPPDKIRETFGNPAQNEKRPLWGVLSAEL